MNTGPWICIHCLAPAQKVQLPDGRERPVCKKCWLARYEKIILPVKPDPQPVYTFGPQVYAPAAPVTITAPNVIFMSKKLRWPGGYDLDQASGDAYQYDIGGQSIGPFKWYTKAHLLRRGYIEVPKPDYSNLTQIGPWPGPP